MTTMPLATLWDVLTRNWAALAIAVTLLSLGLFVALTLAKYVRIALNIFADTPPPLAMGPMDFERLHGEVVRFRSYDGASLRGMWLWAQPTLVQGTIIFCHEFGSDMYSCARYVRPLLDAGFNIFTFDFRGHGESGCPGRYRPLQWPSDKELGDALGAVAYVKTRLQADGLPCAIGLFGISRGAGSAILAACTDEDVKAIACDGAFSTDTTLVSLMKRWAYIFARVKLVYENHPEAFWHLLQWLLIRCAQRRLGCRFPSVRKSLRDMAARPTMLIHGQRDSYIREDQTRLLYAVAPPPRYMWIVPGAKHNQSVIIAPEEYARRTTAFFRKYLDGQEVDERLITGEIDREAGPQAGVA